MKAIIMAYRGSYKTQNPKQMVLKPIGVDSKEEASKLIGKKAIWTSPSGKKLEGKVSAAHGRKGAVRAIFAEKGLPGQSLGKQLEIQ
jgi:large subunit ribosomal protein L35Ae